MKYLELTPALKCLYYHFLLLISLPPSFCRGLIIPGFKVHFEIRHLVLTENKREINLLLKGKVKKLSLSVYIYIFIFFLAGAAPP